MNGGDSSHLMKKSRGKCGLNGLPVFVILLAFPSRLQNGCCSAKHHIQVKGKETGAAVSLFIRKTKAFLQSF